MVSKQAYRNLYAYMNGIFVGTLSLESGRELVFTYDTKWLNSKHGRPISLSMPLTDIPYRGYVVENYFDNLLPDSEIIRERIQKRFQSPSKKCFDLLSFIGRDCVGALQLLTTPSIKNIKKIQAKPLTPAAIATLLKHYQTAPLGMAQNTDFRISVGGAQEKSALLRYQGKWCLPEGTTPTSHIIKLPIGVIRYSNIDLSDSVENEWLCLHLLAAFGLTVNHAEIVHFDDVKTLVLERFDRRWSEDKTWLIRLPQEDMCQALGKPAGLKYQSEGGPSIENIMNVLRGSEYAKRDRETFIKTVFLFWVLGAIDGHAKNFSLSIGEQGRYALTPIYDVISAYPMANKRQIEWQKLKMAMSLPGKQQHYLWQSIRLEHWFTLADRCQFSKTMMQAIIDEVFDTLDAVITQVENKLPKHFPLNIADSVFYGMRRVKGRCASPRHSP